MAKLYTFGDRQNGITFIRNDPYRVVRIPIEDIEEYATDTGSTVDAVIAAILQSSDAKSDSRITDVSDDRWDVSRFFTMPSHAENEVSDDRWDVSRFFTMPAHAENEVSDDRWDVSRFFTMPAHAENEVSDDRWDVSRFFTMPAHAEKEVSDDRWDVSRFFTMPADTGSLRADPRNTEN